MTRLGTHFLATGLLVLLAVGGRLQAAGPAEAPDFQEVYGLIRAHVTDMSEAELNRAAVQALVTGLGPKVLLVTNGTPGNSGVAPALVTKSNLFDDSFAYVRVAQVGDGVASALRDACQRLSATNHLKGIVLDLRYAGGQDYAAAAAAAELFLKKECPLMDWGQGMVQAKPADQALTAPVAVLVNGQTAGAAEALAAVLREAGSGLLLGSQTAGQAAIAQEFPLKNGDRLRIATAPIHLGDGSLLSDHGVTPDISVEVGARDERAYYADAFQPATRSNAPAASASQVLTNQLAGTNRTARRVRFNEAELVRERREGFNPDVELGTGREEEPDRPVVRDPALARALDVLKGLAVVRRSGS